MKKKLLVLITVLMLTFFSSFALVGCNEEETDTRDQQIVGIYNIYVASAEEQGITPLSYEQWLATIKGEKGDKGDTGAQGIQGEKGDKGDTGAQGIQGEKGDKGDTGAQGIQGKKGDKGDTGAQGIQGEKGDKGDTGAQGIQGEKGDKGDTGAQGIQGEKGDKGDTGAQGIQGEKGDKGDTGVGIVDVYVSEDGFLMIKYSDADDYVNVGSVLLKNAGTEGLKYILNEDENTISVDGIGIAFENNIVIPSYYRGYEVTGISANAFSSNNSIKSITIPNTVTSIGEDAFLNCSSLKTVNYLGTVDEWAQINFANYNSNPVSVSRELSINGEPLVEVNLTSAIGCYAFYNCNSLTSVKMADSVESIGASAFYNCSSLTSVKMADSVESIGASAFYNCDSLTYVMLSNNITEIYVNSFGDCDKLVYSMKDGLKYLGNTLNPYLCLMGISANTSSVIIDSNCKVIVLGNESQSVYSVTIPNSVKNICCENWGGARIVEIINHSSLNVESYFTRARVIHSGESKIVNRDGYVFITDDGGTNYLVDYVGTSTEITLPSDYNGENYVIDDYAFMDKSITAVTIPNAVISIGECAFFRCTSLESVTIGDGVMKVGDGAFGECRKINYVNYLGTIESWKEIEFISEWWGSADPTEWSDELHINGELVTL